MSPPLLHAAIAARRASRRRLLALLALSAFAGPVLAKSTIYGSTDGPAVGGYDVVSYFTDGMPALGDARYVFDWNGAVWHFASAEHRDLFKAEPARYAPQYGAYCSFAMSRDTLAPGDAHRWRIVDGKLYLNANLFAQKLFEADIPGRIRAADGHWPGQRGELEAAP